MNEVLGSIGVMFTILILFVFGAWVYEVELFLPSTIRDGTLIIEEHEEYRCTPTEKTLKLREAKRKIEKLKEGQPPHIKETKND